MGDRTRAPGRQRTRDHDPRTRPRHYEQPRQQNQGERLRAERARPPIRARPPKGSAPKKNQGKGKEKGFAGAPNLCAAEHASEASGQELYHIWLVCVFFLAGGIVNWVAHSMVTSGFIWASSRACARGRTIRPRVREVISFIYRHFGLVF